MENGRFRIITPLFSLTLSDLRFVLSTIQSIESALLTSFDEVRTINLPSLSVDAIDPLICDSIDPWLIKRACCTSIQCCQGWLGIRWAH